jgi:Zn-dependent protease
VVKPLHIRPAAREIVDLAISWVVISLCFSIRGIYVDMSYFLAFFASSLIAVGLGFLLHELMHRTIARSFACHAEYRMWPLGLLLALALALASGGSLIFAAPGAVYIVPLAYSPYISVEQLRRVNGLIALAGPMANLVLALVFYLLRGLSLHPFLQFTAMIGFQVNIWLAAFNLLPIPPLDGFSVVKWSPIAWGLVAIPAWAVTVIAFFNP